eukprot:NODE_288_length_11703_cov_0.386591.p6 type:complete len:173 gc:universal NODE_288_length_11703_cov_0.386591:672-154(-)
MIFRSLVQSRSSSIVKKGLSSESNNVQKSAYRPFDKMFREGVEEHKINVRRIFKSYLQGPLTPNITHMLLNQFLNLKDDRERMSLTTTLLHHIRIKNLWANVIREPQFICLVKIGNQSQNNVFVSDVAKWARKTGALTSNVRDEINRHIKTLDISEQVKFKKHLSENEILNI